MVPSRFDLRKFQFVGIKSNSDGWQAKDQAVRLLCIFRFLLLLFIY